MIQCFVSRDDGRSQRSKCLEFGEDHTLAMRMMGDDSLVESHFHLHQLFACATPRTSMITTDMIEIKCMLTGRRPGWESVDSGASSSCNSLQAESAWREWWLTLARWGLYEHEQCEVKF